MEGPATAAGTSTETATGMMLAAMSIANSFTPFGLDSSHQKKVCCGADLLRIHSAC
jgi:hypothetical protein